MTTKVTNIYNLKLTPSQFGQNSIVVNCSQYDSLFRVIQFNLFNGNAVYSIPEGSVVTIRGTKKDNTGFEYECEYSNNVATFPLQQQITIFPGKVPSELRITSNGEIIGSWNFLFLVEESPLTNDTIISETQLPLLESALQAASEAENYKNLAQVSADNALQSAETASESEANALTYSQNAQTSANSASQSEANALTYSQNASESASEAQGFAQDSEDSATQAQGYATSASQGATTAQQIADNIADLVDEAQGYASQSSQSASQAQGYATQASQSATNASQSASNAQTYASNANTSAQNASSSATSAQTYAGNASTSATQSASSATQSAQSATNAQTYASNASTSATQAQGYATNASNSATASADSATESQGYAQNASDSASEAQELVDTVEERIKNKADIDGVYPKLVAGDLIESETKDDVFTYQVTDHTGKANINSIKGNTIVWNQLAENGNFATDTRWIINGGSKSVANNSLTITANDANPYLMQTTSNIKANHKYLMIFDATCSRRQRFNFNVAWTSGNNANTEYAEADTKTRLSVILTPSVAPASFNLYMAQTEVGATAKLENVQLFDLTIMGLDSITSADEFTKLYPLPYYQYNAGELLSFNGTGIKVAGKNLCDNSTITTGYYTSQVLNQDDGYKTSALIPVQPSTTYIATFYNKSKAPLNRLVYSEWDSNGNFIQQSLATALTTSRNTAFVRIRNYSGQTSNILNDDFLFQLELGSTATSYADYVEPSTLSLPIAQHFPNGMDGVGSDYDELTETKATTRMARVDLGTLNWTYNSNYGFISGGLSRRIKGEITGNANGNIMCSKYNTAPYNTVTGGQTDKCIGVNATSYGYIVISDSAYTDAQAFKASLSGVILVYPLVNPTEEDVDLDLSYSTYEGGTEQLLPANTDVPVTSPISMNVEFDFGENLNARFNKVLNMIAPVESAQVSKAYSVGQYLIYDYTLYKVTSNIASGGTITVGTNVTATTLASILESL